jgi:hypothetical protein
MRHGATPSGRPADHSLDGRPQFGRLLPRLIHLDARTMLFWRRLLAGLMILCVIIAQDRHHPWLAIRAIGRPGVAAVRAYTRQCLSARLGGRCRRALLR